MKTRQIVVCGLLAAHIALAFSACPTEDEPALNDLTGTISIIVDDSPVTEANTGVHLTAAYNGSESVTYLWRKDGDPLSGSNSSSEWFVYGATSPTYTPYTPGAYSVMVSAAGYNDMISNAVTVTGNVIPPEDYDPQTDRWWGRWVDRTSTVTSTYTVDAADGVCTITVGGKAQPNNETDNWGRWKANTQYGYTAKANTPYAYTFEAWTSSGNRELGLEYYGDNDGEVWLNSSVKISSTQTTYTIKGERIPKDSLCGFSFQYADQLGTFYVKMISIEEYTPELEFELIEDGTAYRVVTSPGMSGAMVIPDTYNGKPVTEIGYEAFLWNSYLTSVTIPASVTYIDVRAFGSCTNLKTVTFEAGSRLDTIEDSAFWSCVSLASVVIPAKVTFINSWAFGNCTNLTSVTFEARIAVVYASFPEGSSGDCGESLNNAYYTGGEGTYTRTKNGVTWTKQ